MSLQVEKLEHNMAKLTIEVPAEDVEKALQAAYLKERSKISLPGFRKGKVPRQMIEKMYGPEVFYDEAANHMISEAYGKAFDECELEIVSQPKIEVTQLEKGKSFIFTAEVAVKPEVTLGEYKGLKVDKVSTRVTQKEVDEEIEKERERNARTIDVTDRAVQDKDMVTLDFEGFVDGEAFEGGKGENYPLTIGSGSFIDDFEEQLIGHKPGEEVKVNVTFPDDYASEDVAGKDTVFTVTLNYISETELPELNDDFVKENLQEAYGYTSVDDLRTKIRTNLENNKKYNYVWSYMMDNSTFEEIPEELVNPQLDVMIDGLEASLSLQGATLEDYLTSSGYEDEEAMREAYYADCETMVKTYLIADKVAKEQNLKATDQEVTDYFKEFYNTDNYDSYVDYYTRPYINRTVLNNIVTETLADMAQVG